MSAERRTSRGESVPVRPAGTVYEVFCATASRFAANDFLHVLSGTAAAYGIDAGAYSYQQATEHVERLKSRYAGCGLGNGDRVGLLLENRPEMFFHWLALNSLGVSVVPINPEWRSAELEYLIAHSEIRVAVAPATRQDDIASAARAAGRQIVATGPDLAALRDMKPASRASRAPDQDSECALLYTSGTTGRPKGCVLSNAYFLVAGNWYANIGGLCTLRPGRERLVTPLPMSHMNAMACSTMAMLLTGGCIVALDRFHPSSWWDSVREARATIIHYLGVMPAMLLGAPASDRDRDTAVRFGFGAGVSPRLHAAFEARFGFPLLEAWAMTETGAGAAIIANREPRKVGTACFGRPSAAIEFRLVAESGEDAATGSPGELWVRAAGADPRHGFFSEYLKDSQATAAAWQGGYFHTGDIVYRDPEGDLHFVDRKKNVIRRSGENISAVEVEGVLLQHPGVVAAGVAAVPDDIRGDEVMACIVMRTEVTPGTCAALAREMTQFCLDRLAYFKAPGFVAFCKTLPRTATEKIQRAQLLELALSLRDSPLSVDTRAMKKRA